MRVTFCSTWDSNPPNDNFANATVVAGGTVTGSNLVGNVHKSGAGFLLL